MVAPALDDLVRELANASGVSNSSNGSNGSNGSAGGAGARGVGNVSIADVDLSRFDLRFR
jgi:hypothetical protein